MKLISWNVNGIRACVQKGFLDFFKEADADFFCSQEPRSLKYDHKSLSHEKVRLHTLETDFGTN